MALSSVVFKFIMIQVVLLVSLSLAELHDSILSAPSESDSINILEINTIAFISINSGSMTIILLLSVLENVSHISQG